MGHSELRQQKLKVNVIEAGEIKSVVGERVDFVIIGQILVIFVIHLQLKTTLLKKSLKSLKSSVFETLRPSIPGLVLSLSRQGGERTIRTQIISQTNKKQRLDTTLYFEYVTLFKDETRRKHTRPLS